MRSSPTGIATSNTASLALAESCAKFTKPSQSLIAKVFALTSITNKRAVDACS
jgi:hypothetical protein